MQQEMGSYLTPVSLPRPYAWWRRGVDLTFGICGATVLLLALPLLAVCIFLDSPGPIFYQQERVGYLGKTFRMLKFRSMHVHAERMGNAVWAAKGDRRVTRIGRFLRMTHMDELPQVLHILRGEMSLIGPRPERPAYAAELQRADPEYSRRLTVKPGLTGWTQVNYGYGDSEQDELEKLKYDLYYIKHQSIRLDLVILVRTISEVVLCHGQ